MSPESRKTKILVCDDEEMLCELIADELCDAGFDVIQAHSGQEAVKTLSAQKVDVILSDLRMPNGDGLFLLRTVKSGSLPATPVIFMTGHSEMSVQELQNQGASAVISKPINYPKLIDLLQLIPKT